MSSPRQRARPRRQVLDATRRRLALASACALACGDASVETDGCGEASTGECGATGDAGASTGEDPAPQAVCGDGREDEGEECDNGSSNSAAGLCTPDCAWATCGDGYTALGLETCDDGNTAPGDGCEESCRAPSPGYAQLVAGAAHTCLLQQDGAVRCWGENAHGQLGLPGADAIGDDEAPAWTPTVALGGAAVALAAGDAHTCALLEGGAVRCWGLNQFGELGRGDSEIIGDDEAPADGAPVELPPDFEVATLRAGAHHSCALSGAGAAYCWGASLALGLSDDVLAHVGDDEPPASYGPVPLPGPAETLSAGEGHSCAVLLGGDVLCWGSGSSGQLGQGATESALLVADAVSLTLSAPLADALAGRGFTCARATSGEARCWGANAAGQLGLGHTQTLGDDEPLGDDDFVALPEPVLELASARHTCARLESGAVRCWGPNEFGQLGVGEGSFETIGDDERPGDIAAVELPAPAVAVAVGEYHSCALLETGEVRCWGLNARGRLGNGLSFNQARCDGEGVGAARYRCDRHSLCCIETPARFGSDALVH